MIFGLAINLHPEMPLSARQAVQGGILAATLCVMALLGVPLARASLRELMAGRITIELLFLITMIGALCASLQAHLTGQGSIYYEVVSILLIVYTLGKTLGAQGREKASRSSRRWASGWETCRKISDDTFAPSIVPVDTIMVGDVIEVYPGEAIPVDGFIQRGTGYISRAIVTGEPYPVIKRPGDTVSAGCFAHDATFRITASVPGTQRHIDHLIAIMDQARATPLALQSLADRFGVIFLPFVVVAALGTFGGWALLSSETWDRALLYAMSVLLTACPCVIGLATPIVVWMTVGRLAESGIIIRSSDAIERLATVDSVVADKTGTLTDSQFTLLDIITADTVDRAWLLRVLSRIESQSHHPIAQPFAALSSADASHDMPDIMESHMIPGSGIQAVIAMPNQETHTFRIGRLDWLKQSHESSIASSQRGTWETWEAELAATPGHRVAVEKDGEPVALACVSERLRSTTPDALQDFAQLLIPVEILTGDAPGRAEALGLQNPVQAGLLPEEKQQRILALQAAGHKPLMIGDGVNDASALATAHVGVALATGTDLAVSAADIALYHDDLRAIPWAIALCRHALFVARRNMIFALCYNAIGMSCAAAGLLHPLVAVILMGLSSLTLILASMRVGYHTVSCGNISSPGNENDSSSVASRSIMLRAGIHAVALPLQGGILAQLCGWPSLLTGAIICAFAAAGLLLAYSWYHRPYLRHNVDMLFGMFTVGNLGMVFGWWADLGFSAAACRACCSCTDLNWQQPWMWVGMLLFSQYAMYGLNRRPIPSRSHAIAMLTGGNIGMMLGMWGGGSIALLVPIHALSGTVFIHWGAMTVGMMIGMLAGTWLAELLGDAVSAAWQPSS